MGAPILNAYTAGENIDIPLPEGTTKAPAFKRPEGTEIKPKVKEYIKKGEDFEWGDKKNEQFAVSQVVVGTSADDAEAKVDDDKAKVPILILVIVLAILITIVAVIAIRFCILASQKARLTSIKKTEARAEAQLEPQLDERDFDDIFNQKGSSKKQNADVTTTQMAGVNATRAERNQNTASKMIADV